MRFQPGNNMNPAGRPRGSIGMTGWLRRVMAEKGDGKSTNYELAVRKAVDFLVNKRTPVRDFVSLLTFITDRIEGKPISVELTGAMSRENPLIEVDTDILMQRLQHIREKGPIAHDSNQEKG